MEAEKATFASKAKDLQKQFQESASYPHSHQVSPPRLENFELAIVACLDGLWEMSISDDQPLNPHNRVYYSPRFKELLGYADEEFENVVESWSSRLHPDDKERVMTALNNHCKYRIPYRNVEYRLRHKSGVYCWFSAVGQACWNEAGKPLRMAGSICDISDRKRAEESLQEREARYRSLVVATTQIVWVTSPQGQVIEDLPSWRAFTGQGVAEIMGMGWTDAIHPDDCEQVAQVWSQAVEARSLYDTEYRLKGKDGNYYYFAVRGVPVLEADGCIREWVGTCTDITHRQQALDALRQSEAQLRQQTQQLQTTLLQLQQTQSQLVQNEKMSSLGQLVAGVAHEINNPVNFIAGNLVHAEEYIKDLLGLLAEYQQHYPQPVPEIAEEIEAIELDFLAEDLPKVLASMKIGANRIREIVTSLRNFSRLDEAEKKAVDIHDGIDSTLMILQSRLKAQPDHAQIQVIKSYGTLPLVECYAGQLNQVFMNLLSNAIDVFDEYNQQHSEEGNQAHPSTITIATKLKNPDWASITIADNGPGMSAEVLRRIFTPFFTTKPIGKGTGLGLSISYQIVTEKHNGQLRCTSSGGEGTEFTIEIPIRQ
ncbi:MAG: PAS domain-containing sensor histidine kinase [Kastovskya adunca ATA6-11-RM4]|jgi:PAS domain S-box-containing protein|nr:PAS domain-containing sensor histidine kinase [Kastovskya adunca ATA6-11-RM4]